MLEARLRQAMAQDSEFDKIYSKALKWLSPLQLLVGVHAATSQEAERRGNYIPVRYHFKAYVLEVTSGKVLSEIPSCQVSVDLGRSLESLEW